MYIFDLNAAVIDNFLLYYLSFLLCINMLLSRFLLASNNSKDIFLQISTSNTVVLSNIQRVMLNINNMMN